MFKINAGGRYLAQINGNICRFFSRTEIEHSETFHKTRFDVEFKLPSLKRKHVKDRQEYRQDCHCNLVCHLVKVTLLSRLIHTGRIKSGEDPAEFPFKTVADILTHFVELSRAVSVQGIGC